MRFHNAVYLRLREHVAPLSSPAFAEEAFLMLRAFLEAVHFLTPLQPLRLHEATLPSRQAAQDSIG